MNAYNTYIPPILGGFPCSQAHNLLTCDQPDLKDKFSPIKKHEKVQHFDPNFHDGPLRYGRETHVRCYGNEVIPGVATMDKRRNEDVRRIVGDREDE